jgi:YegS/Rv2252/BmrU family lipid kinase
VAETDVLVIVNPASGAAPRELDRRRLRSALRKHRLPTDWIETRPDYGPDRIIAEHPSAGPVVVVGGDGTVHAAARALRGGNRPLAIVPAGSGNVLALRLSIPLLLDQALKVVEEGVIRRLDVGLLEGRPFLLGVGAGIDARIMREADRKMKRHLGKLAYLLGAAKTLPMQHHQFRLRIDGETVHESGASVVVANFGTQVGPWIFPPDAHGGDGLLDVAIIKARTIDQTLSLLTAPFRQGVREEKGFSLFRGVEVEVETNEPLPMQVDGEIESERRRFSCSIEREALPVIVSIRRPLLQWSREWPPPADWRPWGSDREEAGPTLPPMPPGEGPRAPGRPEHRR